MTALAAKVVWVLCELAWFILRYPHARKARRVTVARSGRDLRERLLLSLAAVGLGLMPALYVASGFPRAADYPFTPVQGWLGSVAFALSLWLFYRSHKDLGRNWSVTLEVRERHALVTSGVYRRIRHPMYASFWLWAAAQALLLPNWLVGCAGLAGVGMLFFFRIGREERLMLETFGGCYRDYMARTTRVVPWLY